MIKWEKRDPEVYVSENLRVFSRYAQRMMTVLFRIDGRQKRREGYRVDQGGIMGWEAIDRGQGFRTVRDAKAYAEKYLAAMREQEELSPRVDRDRARRDRFEAAERSGRAGLFTQVARRGGSRTYAEPEVKRTASYKRAERLEDEIAPKRWNTPGLSRSQYERLADAWERAGFFGWADNYRAHVERTGIGRDRSRAAGGRGRR